MHTIPRAFPNRDVFCDDSPPSAPTQHKLAAK